jgi:hypothetical protein
MRVCACVDGIKKGGALASNNPIKKFFEVFRFKGFAIHLQMKAT